MMLSFVDSIGMFDHPLLQLLVVLGVAAIGDVVRLARAEAPAASVERASLT